MADTAITARREARRRRILENSQSRLFKISGKLETGDNADFGYQPKDPEELYDMYKETSTTFTNETVLNSVLDDSDMLDNLYFQKNNGTQGNTPNSSTTKSNFSLIGNRLLSIKLDIMLLSLFIQFLYVSGVEFIRQTYLFLPLFMLSVIKLYFLHQDFNNNGIVNTLLVMSGVQARNVFVYIKTFLTFLEDAAIYLFTFILTQVIYVIFLDKIIMNK